MPTCLKLKFVSFHCMLIHTGQLICVSYSSVALQVCWADHEMRRCWLPLLMPIYFSSSSRVLQRRLQDRTRQLPQQPPQRWWCCHRRLHYQSPFLCRRLPATCRPCLASVLHPALTWDFGRMWTPHTRIDTPATQAGLSRQWLTADHWLVSRHSDNLLTS